MVTHDQTHQGFQGSTWGLEAHGRGPPALLPSFPPSLPETAAKHLPPLLSLISVPWEMGLFLTWPRGQEPAPRGPAPGNGRSRECAGSAAATDSDRGRFLPTVSARWWLHAPGGPAAASRSARV